MNFIIDMLIRLRVIVPTPIKSVLRSLGFNIILSYFWNKYMAELRYQVEWAKKFENNKFKVLEYWKKYRYLDEIDSICKIEDNMIILDVGCGISTVLHFIKGERYGIDPLANEYKKIYSYPEGINIQKAFGEDIPFKEEYFDVIFCSNALDHVSDPQKTVDEIHRVLKPSGYFVLTVEIFRKKTNRTTSHPHCLTKQMVHSLLQDKFKIIFEKETPSIGESLYVNGSCQSHLLNKQLIMILKKR